MCVFVTTSGHICVQTKPSCVSSFVCVCGQINVCVCMCVRACVRACVCVCMCVCSVCMGTKANILSVCMRPQSIMPVIMLSLSVSVWQRIVLSMQAQGCRGAAVITHVSDRHRHPDTVNIPLNARPSSRLEKENPGPPQPGRP